MANDAKRTSQLSVTTSLSANDRLVVLTNPTTSAQTQTTTLATLANTLVSNNILPVANATVTGVIKIGKNLIAYSNGVTYVQVTGPYADDETANTAGITVGQLYYTAAGAVKIRLT